jgi:hypothetical protein
MTDEVQIIKDKITPILKEQEFVLRASLFGSFARGDEDKDSDVDILIKISKPINLLEFFDLKEKLEQALSKKVDLVSEDAVLSQFHDYIYQDIITLYNENNKG